jgi:hypothetical protein
MSYAVKIGTTEIQWIHDAPTPEGYVRYDGELLREADGSLAMVWDTGINNIRAKVAADYAAEAAALVIALRNLAKDALDNNRDFLLKVDRAVLMAVNDAINQANTRFNSLRSQILAATSLANLQTRVGQVEALPTRTDAQAITAVKDRITGGTVE